MPGGKRGPFMSRRIANSKSGPPRSGPRASITSHATPGDPDRKRAKCVGHRNRAAQSHGIYPFFDLVSIASHRID